MRFVLALVLLLIGAPMVAAQAPAVPAPAPTDAQVVVVPAQLAERTEVTASETVPAEARAVAEAPVAAQPMPARGSFWWIVGAIVIAGVILTVLL